MGYLDTLNDEQREVVYEPNGKKVVVASAGSGKTRVIIAKILHLIQDLGVLPSTIWVGTFTKKAKEELVERLAGEIGMSDAKKVKIGTLHSLAYSVYKDALMRVDGIPRSGLPKPLVNDGVRLFQIFNFIRANEKKVFYRDGKDILSMIDTRRMEGTTLENFRNMHSFDNSVSGWCREETIFRAWLYYENWKRSSNQLDFGDMLTRCVAVLKDRRYSRYLEGLQRVCKYIMIDEAQDNNTLNYELARMLSAVNGNVMVVGDSRQSIYSFQGSSLSNLHDFIGFEKPKMYNLCTNYRSTKTIVDNSNVFMKGEKGIIGKEAVAFQPEGEPIKVCMSGDETDEARNVARLIENLVDDGEYTYRDIAILYRVHSQSVMIEAECLGRNIPYVAISDNSFFDKKEIRDLTAYLTAFDNPHSFTTSDLKQVANRPNRYISSKAISSVIEYCNYEEVSVYEALGELGNVKGLDYRNMTCLQSLLGDIVAGSNKKSAGADVETLIQFILDNVGYEQWVQSSSKVQDSDVTMDFDAIVNLVRQYNKTQTIKNMKSVSSFFNYVKETRKLEEQRKKDTTGNYVQMMTYHASKGKEFPVVIMLGNCTRIAPFHRNPDRSEEKRLIYVAMTRPEKELYISTINGMLGRYNVSPSPFLYSLKGKFVPKYYGSFTAI